MDADHRLSTTSVASRNLRTLTRMKRVKVSMAFSVLLIMYTALYASGASDNIFLVVGGFLGGCSAIIVVTDGIIQRIHGSNLAMLFWRSICDLGLAIRFILTPAFNYYTCGDYKCYRNDGGDNTCRLPGAMLQFFIVASEMWFLCNAIDLYSSITNPFSSFKVRIKYYHVMAWTMALLVSIVPLSLSSTSHQVYGYWYVNDNISDSNICWLSTGADKLGFSVWALFLVPLAMIYIICLVSLVVAYTRLRRGLTRTFLPKMKLLVTNTINVLVLALFWAIFVFLYAWTFLTRDQKPPNYDLNSFLYFTFASKGFSSLFVWIFVSDYNMKLFSQQDEGVDTNVALREEVLTFATAGIRSAARDGPLATPERAEIVRRPEKSRMGDTNLIGMLFYFKFLMGYSEEIRTVEKMISRKRRSIHDSFARQMMLRESDAAGQYSDVHAGDRMSQRTTVAAGQESKAERATELGEASVVDMVEVHSFAGKVDNRTKKTSIDMIMTVSEASSPNKPSTSHNFLAQINQSLQSVVSGDTWDEVEFTEFQPYHFRRIRLSCGVADEMYLSAFSTTIKERLTEGGASGAFFFFSKGENFIAKSCTEEEVNTLKTNALEYANYLVSNPNSYISKILGVYRLRIYGNSLNFFVMNNLFYNTLGLTMNEKYDIKGSWVARNAKPPLEGRSLTCSYCEQKFIYRKKKNFSRLVTKHGTGGGSNSHKMVFEMHSNDSRDMTTSPLADLQTIEEGTYTAESLANHCRYTVSGMHEPNVILKDNDLKFKIRLPLEVAITVLRQLRKDSEFLASLGIMDYSLLLGVHNTEYEVQPLQGTRHTESPTEESAEPIPRPSSILRRAHQSMVPFANSDTMVDESKHSPTVSFLEPTRDEAGVAQAVDGPSTSKADLPQSDSSESVPTGEGEDREAASASNQPGRLMRRRTLTHAGSAGRTAGLSMNLSAQGESTASSGDSAQGPSGAGSDLSSHNGNREAPGMTKMLEVFRVVGPDTYFLGIIDFQQKWNWAKKMERFFKVRIQGADADGLSAVEPEQYKERFLRRLEDVIDVDTGARMPSYK